MTAQSAKHYDKNINIPYGSFAADFYFCGFLASQSAVYPCQLYPSLRPDRYSQRRPGAMALEVFTAQNKYSFYFSDIWCAVGLAYNGKALLLPAPHFNFLVIALLSILFIGAIAFPIISLPLPCTLYPHLSPVCSLPKVNSGYVCCIVSRSPLPALRCKTSFKTQRCLYPGLMDKLLQERNTLNDLSMLDPLTGLYNRRGLQNRLDTLLAVVTVTIMYCCWILTTLKPTTTTMAI